MLHLRCKNDFNRLDCLTVPPALLSTMINMFGECNNLQFLNVYWCDNQMKTTKLLDILLRFTMLEILSVADIWFFPEEISSNGKSALQKLKKLSLSKISFDDLLLFLSQVQ